MGLSEQTLVSADEEKRDNIPQNERSGNVNRYR